MERRLFPEERSIPWWYPWTTANISATIETDECHLQARGYPSTLLFTMKHLAIPLPALLLSVVCTAQAPTPKDSTQYLFGGNMRVSGGGGFMMQVGNVAVEDGLVTGAGGGGGVLFADRLLLGGYGMGMTTNVHRTLAVNDSLGLAARLNFGHGGVWVQYSITPHRAIHPVVNMQLGWGSASWQFDGNGSGNGNKDPQDISDLVMVITPSAGVEFNIKPWFRPNLYIGYRSVSGLDLVDVGSDGLNGVFGGVSLLFGGFFCDR